MNKLVVVSGGTKGIGRALVERFARNSFDILTCARNKGALEHLKKVVEEKYGVALNYRVVDMSVREEVIGYGDYILRQNRSIEVLVNNVGHFIQGPIAQKPDGVLEKMLDVNLFSAYYLTSSLVDSMKTAKKGHIFFICSIASLSSYPNAGAYSISKFALLGLSKALRQELMGCGIRVTAVMPGATLTDSWSGTELPADRFIHPDDVAESVYGAYALSPQSVVEELIIRPQLGDL